MTSGPVGGQVEAAAETVDERATEAFALLANEVRLSILLALWEAYDPANPGATVAFSDLRERVGARDSGNFNYHLGKLDERFVARRSDGYVLLPAGLKLVQTVVGDAGHEGNLPEATVDVDCHLCGAETAITYREGWLYHVCTACSGGLKGYVDGYPSGTLFAEPFPAAALGDRTPEAVFAAGVFALVQSMRTKAGGLCPGCSSAIETDVAICATHDPDPGERCATCGYVTEVRIHWTCPTCKYAGGTSPATVGMLLPESVAAYAAAGVRFATDGTDFDDAVRTLEIVRAATETVVSTDPLRVRVTAGWGDVSHSLVLDERLRPVAAG